MISLTRIVVLLCFSLLLLIAPARANTIDTAKGIALGTPMSDALSTGETTIYYQFTLQQAGYVNLNFTHNTS